MGAAIKGGDYNRAHMNDGPFVSIHILQLPLYKGFLFSRNARAPSLLVLGAKAPVTLVKLTNRDVSSDLFTASTSSFKNGGA